MSATLRNFLIESGKGNPQHLSAFKNTLDIPGGRQGTAWICAIDGTLYIAAISEGIGRAIEVPLAKIRILNNFWGKALQIGETTFSLPFGSTVHETLASAILYKKESTSIEEQRIGAWTCDLSLAQRLWIEANFEEDEELIAAIETATPADVPLSLEGSAAKEYLFLLSDRRCGLLGQSEFGESQFYECPHQDLIVERGFGRSSVRCGPLEWKATLTNTDQYTAISHLPSLTQFDRIRATVLLLPSFTEQKKRLYGKLKKAPDPLNRFISTWMFDGGDLQPILQELMETPPSCVDLCAWMKESGLSHKEYRLILEKCLSLSDSPHKASWSLPLHEATIQMNKVQDHTEELSYIEHLLYTKNNAQDRLNQLIKTLPNEEWHLSIPAQFTAIQKGESLPSITLRAYILQEQYASIEERPYILAQLLRCEPLSVHRAKALAECSHPILAQKGQEIYNLLVGGAQIPHTLPSQLPFLSPVDQEALRHPVTKSGGVLDGLTAWVSQAQTPDFGLLQKYCAHISEEEHPNLSQALRRICAMLDMPVPPMYISWGEHSIGIRSHESPKPFVILGGEHLKANSPYFLSTAELSSLVAMELWHLKNQTSRVTSDDFWQGLLSKGGVVLEGALTFVPLLKNIPSVWTQRIDTYNTIRSIVPTTWIDQIYDQKIKSQVFVENETKHSGLSIDPSTILMAYRALQFNSDRIALIATGSLQQTIQSFFIGNPALLSYKNLLTQQGLTSFYKAELPAPLTGAQENITLRAACLISFYLSDIHQEILAKFPAPQHDSTPEE